jgi:hypothetical protein
MCIFVVCDISNGYRIPYRAFTNRVCAMDCVFSNPEKTLEIKAMVLESSF